MVVLSLSLAAFSAAATVPACIAGGPPIDPITNEGGGFAENDAGTPDAWPDAPVTEPHAVVGATPSHGPFSGGNRVFVTGNGFDSKVRVWFGDTEAGEVTPIDATRLQVTAPPGARGPVDLTTQNGDDDSTARTLPGGYHYDALYADPSSGPISGGSEVRIVGQGTDWGAGASAFIDNKPCTTLTVTGPEELLCVVPQGAPGAKAVRVENGDETISVLDAYTYEDSSDGFKGGLSGDPLAGTLRVLVYDNFTGNAIAGAHVVIGEDISTAIIEQVGLTGVVEISDAALEQPVTVSVSALCHSPISFVDVPVDTVTVYLDPVLSPACAGAGGDPPGVGGKFSSTGVVQGEIVFPAVNEFQRGPFLVPQPIGNEMQAAYIFAANTNPAATFQLPPATSAILPTADGSIGYGFALASAPGSKTYYALAGLEDRTKSPPTFVAYSMGLVRGVPVVGDETTSEVFIDMVPLDLALTLDASPPPPGVMGPDRLQSSVAVRLGTDGFAILPSGQKAPLLPLNNDVTFVGLPLLDAGFEGSTYYASARAVTGPSFLAPMSVVSSLSTNTTAFPIVVDGFVGLPELESPTLNATWNGTQLETSFGPGAPPDLTVYDISGGNGLVHWTVAVPGGGRAIELPDLRVFPGEALPGGSIVVGVYGARVTDFDYATLRTRSLRPQGMSAYSLDFVEAHLP